MNTTEPLIRKSTHDFALLVAGQIHAAGLSEEVEKHYLAQKQKVCPALKGTFVLPGAIPLPVAPVETQGYPIEETDCLAWLGHLEWFAKEHFATEIVLRDKFPIPVRLPWKQVLPIFDPGFTNREMVDKLKAQELSVYESVDVMRYAGSGAFNAPRLYLVERSLTPTAATMGLPPKFARHWFAGRQTVPLNLRGYGIGTSLWHKVESQFLDPQTWTWFPENTLPDGRIACGRCDPARGEVKFCYDDASDEHGNCGFREAILLLQT